MHRQTWDLPSVRAIRRHTFGSGQKPWKEWLYQSLLHRVLLPAGDLALRHSVTRRLEFLQRAQWWSRDELHAVRDAHLSRLAYIAYTEVPFYKDLFDKHGVAWTDIRTAQDLRRLPIITKDMIRAGYPGKVTRKTGLPVHEESSSGSTGAPFYVLEDSETASLRRAAFLLALSWAGWTLGEPHLQTGVMTKRSGERRLKDMVLRCHYASALDLSDAAVDLTLDYMDFQRIRHLWGYPCMLHQLAVRAKVRGWNRPIDSVVTWGDTLTGAFRSNIEGAFRRSVVDTYGCSEGIQVAAQCGEGDHYHIHSLDTFVEAVDDQGRPVPDGEPGNLLLTRLQPGAMPLIRYAVGDIGAVGGSRQCPCGRGLDILESVEGRQSDYIETPSGKRLMVHYFSLVLEYFPAIEHFQVVQKDLHSLEVRCVFSGEGAGQAPQIVEKFRKTGLTDMRIDIVPVSEIPVPATGKRRFVLSELTQPTTAGA